MFIKGIMSVRISSGTFFCKFLVSNKYNVFTQDLKNSQKVFSMWQ